ncbi:MAG: hypothetical protein ACYTKD_09260, partial [Planctomycetota bacterium]
ISSGLQRFFLRTSPIEQPSLQMLTLTQGCPFQAEPEHDPMKWAMNFLASSRYALIVVSK